MSSRGQFAIQAACVTALAVILPLIILGCGKKADVGGDGTWPANHTGPKVVVSFAPLYCFAVNVAGDDAVVRNVMTTTGPHDFSPTEQDERLVTKASLFFVNGLGLDESKAELMKKGSGNDKMEIINLGARLPKEKLCEGHCEHANHNDPNHKHDMDPHVWLSPDHAVLIVNIIRDELKAADPAHAAGYDQRAAAYVAKLNDLKAYGIAKLKDKKDNRLVTFHDSLTYFANCYGLEIRGVLTQTPGQEPTAKQMKTLINVCTDETKPTRIIAVEPQYSTSTSGATLKKELASKGVTAELVEIDTLETVKPEDLTPDWYEKRMRANLDALAEKLK